MPGECDGHLPAERFTDDGMKVGPLAVAQIFFPLDRLDEPGDRMLPRNQALGLRLPVSRVGGLDRPD